MDIRKKITITFPSEVIIALEKLANAFKTAGVTNINDAYWEYQNTLKEYPSAKLYLSQAFIKQKVKPDPFSCYDHTQIIFFNSLLNDSFSGAISSQNASEWLLNFVNVFKQYEEKTPSKSANPASFFTKNKIPQKNSPTPQPENKQSPENEQSSEKFFNPIPLPSDKYPNSGFLEEIVEVLDGEYSKYEKFMGLSLNS